MWLLSGLVPALLLIPVTTATEMSSAQFEQFQLNAKPCPEACVYSHGPAEWNFFHDLESLSVCPEPILLDFNLYTPIDSPNAHVTIRACTLKNADTNINFLAATGFVDPEAHGETNFGPVKRRDASNHTTCGSSAPKESKTTANLAWWVGKDSSRSTSAQDISTAVKHLKEYIDKDSIDCENTIIVAYVRGTLVGLYSGAQVDKRKSSGSLLELFEKNAETDANSAARKSLEICGDSRTASTIFGVVADATGDFAAIQKIMKSWNEGECVAKASSDGYQSIKDVKYWSHDDASILKDHSFSRIDRRDMKPRADKDGICAYVDVSAGQGCQAIASKNGIKIKDLETFNKKTWGWNGCDDLQVSQRICVSQGNPPMPAPVSNAMCGPTVKGTEAPAGDQELKDLNPCPLDVCCNVWGNCGTTDEFCVVSKSETGNPGTSKPGANGCVSNCGMEIVNNDKGPAQYRKVGYFEAWNYERDCLHMHVKDIDKSWTHVHFAFGEIGTDMSVVIPDNSKKQWKAFKATQTFKKVLAFGGWAFSNEGSGSGLFRKAVSPANRNTFANNVVKFAKDNSLDGLDFDWEYPGATDIDGAVKGEKEDGENYLQFLKLVREKLPEDMTLSVAAPASYWYLKGFPIKKMAPVLDYIIYMTYDLHGQWDVGNEWTSPGCPAGNCLRSHVNATETHAALVMITKAGVPSHKVVVGVTSYGRSFKMKDSTCRGPQCTYLGTREDSLAKKGRCTDTAGYISDFEINEIIKKGGAIKSWYDEDTDADYLVYDGIEWVSYMSKLTKSRRQRDYMKLNFGGTTDWAIDLQNEGSGKYDNEDEDDDDEDDDGKSAPPYKPDPKDDELEKSCPFSPTTIDEIFNLDYNNELPARCVAKYMIPVLHAMFQNATDRYEEILEDGYAKYFDIYAQFIVGSSDQAMSNFMFSNGSDFFDCKIWQEYGCCRNCDSKESCFECIEDCKISSPFGNGHEWKLKEQPCPPDYSKRGMNPDRKKYQSIYWSFQDDDAEEEFYAEAYANVGVPEDKIVIRERSQIVGEEPDHSCDGMYNWETDWDKMSDTCKHENYWHNAPGVSTKFSPDDVFNPEDAIKKSLKDIDINEPLGEFSLAVLADDYRHDAADLVDALIIPILMLHASIDHMETVVKMAKEIKKAEVENLVTHLLSSVLLVAGGVGSVLFTAGFKFMGRTLVGLAEAGNTALGIYTAVGTPESVPLLLFGLVMSASSIRDVARVAKSAKMMRAMKYEEIADFSAEAARITEIVAKINKREKPAYMCGDRYS